MGRRESMTIGELIITKGIRGQKAGRYSKVVKCYAGVPATIVANRYWASAVMQNGAYTLLNNGLPGDGLAHNITITHTAVSTVDTLGSILFTGLDINGKLISESIIPVNGSVAPGLKGFAKVISAVGVGWTSVAGSDTITIGFAEVIGLPDVISATTDVLLVGVSTAIVNAPTVVVGLDVCQNTVLMTTGDGTKKLTIIYQA